ncbi:alpha/beta fold hydrolase [Nonomuraea fuscirosea]|uniref:alpha/beta fold hydrolase n=1 Tax=Nonomuraea fuscirosea TaxID=1291556 RepID=UPI003714C688
MPGSAGRVKSADGTVIAFDRRGEGPAVVLVQGAFTDRRHPLMTAIADGLARWFTVYSYDRRGRGDSGDTAPYAVEREIEDLAAVIDAAIGAPDQASDGLAAHSTDSGLAGHSTDGAAGDSMGSSAGHSTGDAAGDSLGDAAGDSLAGSTGGSASGAGGSVMVFGGSSGAALALEAAVVNPAIAKLAVWEPPYHVDDGAPALPLDFARRLDALVGAGRRGEAVERFMVEAAEVPPADVAAMRSHAFWAQAEAMARTLVYEAEVLGPGNALPAARLAGIKRPTLVLNGALSPRWMANAGAAVAGAIPGAVRRVLEGQAHNVAPEALVPEVLEFFVAA